MKRRNNELIGIIFVTVLVSVLLLSIPAALGDSTRTMAAAIELGYDFAEPAIGKPVIGKIDIGEQEYDTVSIPGCDMYGAPGEPVLPFKTARILIPYGEEVRDIQVVPGKEIYLGEFYIEPGQAQVPISFTGPIAPTQPDKVIYNSDKAYPEENYLEVSVQGMQGYQILILNLYPVKYVPKARKLSCFESMQVVVSTTASAPSELFRGIPEDRAEAAEIIDNPDALSTYDPAKASKPKRSPLSPEYDYVIITNEALKGTGGPSNFQALCDSKIANGMSATIVTTEWIYANYGGLDEQTMIRNFIIDAYSNGGTSYVLLGGDGDGADVGGERGDAIIPARGFWTGLTGDECTPPNIPADMYYSCLDGTFDHNGNGIYGEPNDGPGGGEVDLFAEVYVGRAPVDTQAEVSNFVKKTIAYESAAFVPKALMVGEYLGWTPWGGDYKDEVKERSTNWSYTTVGFPQPPFVVDTLYDRDYPGNWPAYVLIDRLNNNPNIVNHIGHANPTYVMKLSNSNVDGLTNSNYFFGYTQGCYAGSFDNRWSNCNYGSSDCILEHFVVADHGAFAFIGNSRYGWGSTSNTNGDSQRFDRQFWDAVFDEGITRIGKANADSKEDNVGLIGDYYIRFCYYELNLFGDPAIPLKCKETPQCDGTDTSCGSYPNCENCNDNDGCYGYADGCEERDYYCESNEAGCNHTYSHRQIDYYDDFVNYCKGDEVWKHRQFHDFYCDAGSCTDHTSWVDDQLVENCSDNDGWVDTGNTRWVDDPGNSCKEKEQKEQEYHDYTCSDGACTYIVTDTHWVDTGNTRNKDDGTICGCTASNTLKRCYDGICTDTGICNATICGADAACDGRTPGESCGAGSICDSTCKCVLLPPEITAYAPESPVNDSQGATRTFNLTITQTVNVSWQINGTVVQADESVTEASYTNLSAVVGTWNVSAIVNNANGTDMQTWIWNVTSPCFIATAAYGTPLHADIAVLREFRDEYLMQNPVGRTFVKIYYSTSPPIADLVRDNDGLRLIVREGLVKTSVYVARRFVD